MITITIRTINVAFGDGNLDDEVARILAELAVFISKQYLPSDKPLFDINGNRVGSIRYEVEV